MNTTHKTVIALTSILALACPLSPVTTQYAAAEAPRLDQHLDQAWRIYRAYKQAQADLERTNSRLKLVLRDFNTNAPGISGGVHRQTAGYQRDIKALREQVTSLNKRIASLENSWDANFASEYGPLSHALQVTTDPSTKSKSDSIADRLNYAASKSAAAVATVSKPVWRLVSSSVYKSQVDNVADYSLQEGEGSRGSINAQETVTLDKTRPPEIRSGCLTWYFDGRVDMDSLVPGEKLKWSASVTDTSGIGCVLGSLKFESFGMSPKCTTEGGVIFYESPPNGGSIEKHGTVVVPSGTVGDKILLRGKVSAGRCSIVYDDVYLLQKAGQTPSPVTSSRTPTIPAPSRTPAGKPSANPDDSAEKAICGTWNSQWGPVVLESAGLDAAGRVLVKGSWQQPSKGTGTVERGSYDPRTGHLEFTYFQPWNKVRGTASFSRSGDGRRMVGSFSQPPSYTGAWTLNR